MKAKIIMDEVEKCESALKIAREIKSQATQWSRVGRKACYISNMINERYQMVKSYSTLVALVDISENEFYEFGKFSPTTSRQMTQVCNTYYTGFKRYFYREEI